MPVQNISDTARWVAVYRAMESERADAHFHDPFAARLAGAEGITIVNKLKRGRALAWSMIVRTAVFDDLIMDRVRHGSIDTVINLAAGLDTRAWRLPLPPTLRWFDVDLPEITEELHSSNSDGTKGYFSRASKKLTVCVVRCEQLHSGGC